MCLSARTSVSKRHPLARSVTLRIADGSIAPRATARNTMSPFSVIGEHAGEILRMGSQAISSGNKPVAFGGSARIQR